MLLLMFNEPLENGLLPPILTQASIFLLLDKDKDPTSCDSYKPLSFLNADVKVLAKIIALRLERVLSSIFLRNRMALLRDAIYFSTLVLF